MESRKRKNIFIKYNIPRDVNSASEDVKALEAFVKVAIPKESTLLGLQCEFMFIVGSKIGPASTPKDSNNRVVGFFMKQPLKGCPK